MQNPTYNAAPGGHLEHEKHDAQHMEIAPTSSADRVSAHHDADKAEHQSRSYDKKWERKTVTKIDVRLLIIRECARARATRARNERRALTA